MSIERADLDIDRLLNELRALSARGRIILHVSAPVSDDERMAVERSIGHHLPDDLQALYASTNGLRIAVPAPHDAAPAPFASVLSVGQLAMATKALKPFTEPDRLAPGQAANPPHRFIPFATLRDGDVCCLDADRPSAGSYAIVSTGPEPSSTFPDQRTIAGSFTEWFANVVEQLDEQHDRAGTGADEGAP